MKKEDEFTSSHRSNLTNPSETLIENTLTCLADLRRLIPVVLDIVQVELEDRPERVLNVGSAVAVREEPVRISDDRGSAKSRAIYISVRNGKMMEVC